MQLQPIKTTLLFLTEKTITRNFVCLAGCDQLTVPTNCEKLLLKENGLGEKGADPHKCIEGTGQGGFVQVSHIILNPLTWLTSQFPFFLVFQFQPFVDRFLLFIFPGPFVHYEVVANSKCWCAQTTRKW